MILALWDNMLRLWKYQNDALNKDDNKRVAQFKIEALDQYIERLETRHNDLRSKLHDFQERHMERREHYSTIAGNVGHRWRKYTWTKQKTEFKGTHIFCISFYKDAYALTNQRA
jgi:hypothetical protein